MALSTRDKWILALAPGVIVAAWYFYGAGGKAQTRLTQARADLEAGRAGRIDVRVLQAAMQTNGKLQGELAAARELANNLALQRPLPSEVSALDRGEPLQVISKTLAANDLYLVKSERLEGDGKASVPGELQQLWTLLPENARPSTPQVWRFEVRGSFTNFHEAVDALSKSKAFIVPLSISMEPWNIGIFKWTVTVWL